MSKKCLAIHSGHLQQFPLWDSLSKNVDERGKINALFELTEEQVNDFIAFVDSCREFKERHGSGGIEKNPAWQQIILYGLVVQNGKFFVYRRPTKEKGKEAVASEKETRHAGMISVGVGGHIEPFDRTIRISLLREIAEELHFIENGKRIGTFDENNELLEDVMTELLSVDIVGLIKYESDSLGLDHIGLFCMVRVNNPSVDVALADSEENLFGKLMSHEEYADFLKQGEYVPETWTELVMKSKYFGRL